LAGDPFPAELLGARPPAGTHPSTELRIPKEPKRRGGDRLRVVRRDEEALFVTSDHALVAVDIAADDRGPGRHRLEEDDPERLAAGRGRDVDVGCPEELGLLVVADTPQELDALEPAGHDVPASLPLLWARADDEEPAVAASLAHDPVRLEELQESLAGLVTTDEQDVPAAVLPARDRDGPLVPPDVDPVGDDLVITGEVAIDEVAGGRAHGDPPVEPACAAPEDAPPELVRGREASVRVERGDVHAPRFLEQHERQERHERLVEVEEVEALLVEHPTNLGDIPGREREGSHRAIRGTL